MQPRYPSSYDFSAAAPGHQPRWLKAIIGKANNTRRPQARSGAADVVAAGWQRSEAATRLAQ